jgi:hypothetical protein
MEVKNVLTIQIEKNERIYTFSIPMGAPYGECIDVAFEVLKGVNELSQQAVKNTQELLKKAAESGESGVSDGNQLQS